jgi:hypothetical protein
MCPPRRERIPAAGCRALLRPPHRLGRLAADMVNAARKNPAVRLAAAGEENVTPPVAPVP